MDSQIMHPAFKYNIPHKFIEEFISRAGANVDDSNEHLETLAVLSGEISGNEITAKELIFPSQRGTACDVEDLGKLHIVILKIICSCY